MVPVCGKPLIGWTIEQALAASLVDDVIVSTDGPDIGEYAQSLGATVFWRSPEMATDTASSESALMEVLNGLDYSPDLIVFLQATSPIRQPNDINNAIIHIGVAESLFSCRVIEGYTWTAGHVIVTPNYHTRERRQVQRPRRLEENGSIYVFRPEVLRRYGKRLGGEVAYYEMHPLDSFQVDEPADIALMEQLIPLRLQVGAYSS